MINKGVLIRGTAKGDQTVLPPNLRDLVHQELHEKILYLGEKRVYQLAKRMVLLARYGEIY